MVIPFNSNHSLREHVTTSLYMKIGKSLLDLTWSSALSSLLLAFRAFCHFWPSARSVRGGVDKPLSLDGEAFLSQMCFFPFIWVPFLSPSTFKQMCFVHARKIRVQGETTCQTRMFPAIPQAPLDQRNRKFLRCLYRLDSRPSHFDRSLPEKDPCDHFTRWVSDSWFFGPPGIEKVPHPDSEKDGKGWKGSPKPPKLVWIIPSLCKQPKAPRHKGPNKGTCWNYWCFNLGIDLYFDPDFQVLASPASPQELVDAHMRDAWLGSSHGTCERLHGLHLTSGKKDTNRIKQYKIQMCHLRFAVHCQPSFRLSAVYFQSKPRTSRDWSDASLPFTMTQGYVQCRPWLPSCKIYDSFVSIFSWQSLGYVNSPGPQLFLAAVQKG